MKKISDIIANILHLGLTDLLFFLSENNHFLYISFLRRNKKKQNEYKLTI